MVRTDDGICHLFYARWPKPFERWIDRSEVAYATADHPLGPYIFKSVVLGARGSKYWDGISVYNPTVLKVGEKFYLYYTGNNGAIRARRSADGRLITQQIGVAVANHPAGPWKRMDCPVVGLSPEGIDSNFCCNPSVAAKPGGGFLLIYKCGAGDGKAVYHATAESDSPVGPFKKHNREIFTAEGDEFPAEDPFVWYQNDRYCCILKDMRGSFSNIRRALIQFESEDGLEWKPSQPVLVSPPEITWADGEVENLDHLERPQVWLDEGKPSVLFLAAKKGDESFNVHVPLRPFGTASKHKGW